MAGEKKSSDVPEQLYGYLVQLPRMAVHLLDAALDAKVCLEHIDDVATLGPDGDVALEQSKSSFSGNPVANRALPFWKTMSNWVDAVTAKKVVPAKTTFSMHVAQTRVCGAIIAALRDAKTETEVAAAILAARTEFWGPAPDFPERGDVPDTLVKYVENVFTAPPEVLAGIVAQFTVDMSGAGAIEEVTTRARKMLVSNDLMGDFVKYTMGWLQDRVMQMIEGGEIVIVDRGEFHSAMLAFVRKYDRVFQLSPWAREPTVEELDQELQKIYVRQLDLIEAEADEKLSAATSYLKSIVDRTEWARRVKSSPPALELSRIISNSNGRRARRLWALSTGNCQLFSEGSFSTPDANSTRRGFRAWIRPSTSPWAVFTSSRMTLSSGGTRTSKRCLTRARGRKRREPGARSRPRAERRVGCCA